MRSKLLAGTAALFLTGCAVLVTAAPASAQARWHHGFWPGAVAAGVISGAVAAATSPLWAPGYYDYYPGYGPGPYYDYAPAAPVAGADVDGVRRISAPTIRQRAHIWALTASIIPVRNFPSQSQC